VAGCRIAVMAFLGKSILCIGSLAILLVMIAPTLEAKARTIKPADPSASKTAKKVLDYLAGLPEKEDKRVISGQLVFYDSQSNFPDWWAATAQQSGHAPGLMHADNRCARRCSIGAIPPDVLQKLIDHWNAGGLVMVSAHHSNPLTGGSPKDKNFSSDGFHHLLTPGDPVNSAYLAELDLLARQLQTLADSGVVVLYRPLLEMNGDWYWWTMGTAGEYIELWRMEFDYLTRVRGLHNLLFVWAPNAESGRYADYYPGDQYVDVAALDIYQPLNGVPLPKVDGYDQLTTIIAGRKPFGLAEYGPLDPDTTTFAPQDYYQLIAGIKQNMPKTTFWASHWYIWSLGLANPPSGHHLHIPELFADPWVVHEGEINFSGRAATSLPASVSTETR
jgi:mannan endo-1,4-beta-mannosidase